MENSERDYRRREALVGPGAISRDVWDQTVADRDRARAQLAEARQGLSLLAAGSRPEDIEAARRRCRPRPRRGATPRPTCPIRA